MIDFTKDELYEIEKTFDLGASQIIHQHRDILLLMHKLEKNDKLGQILDEVMKSHNIARNISKKCEDVRK
jgi:hypothetical protein